MTNLPPNGSPVPDPAPQSPIEPSSAQPTPTDDSPAPQDYAGPKRWVLITVGIAVVIFAVIGIITAFVLAGAPGPAGTPLETPARSAQQTTSLLTASSAPLSHANSAPTEEAVSSEFLDEPSTATTDAYDAELDSSAPDSGIAGEAVPLEYTDALNQAAAHLADTPTSKQAEYNYLISENGGYYSPEAAQYAVDNVDADWQQNAVDLARMYRDDQGFDADLIYQMLTAPDFALGGFTDAQAQYALETM